MFEEYNPLEEKMLQILDDDGRVIHPEMMPDISDDQVVRAYKLMLYTRVADLRAVSYQRQGRMYTYPPCLGQEATAVGTAMAMQESDWLVPAYRELGAYFCKGATVEDIFLIWGGHEDGFKFPNVKNLLPMCVPIASQTLHAVGIAYGLKYRKQEGIVFTYFGEGGTSEGDFHEALNFAGVWKVPVMFICQNNQYAISMPRNKQTASKSIAIKAIGYGIKGIQVDGNDFMATYAAASAAANHLRKGGEAVLIECMTYRRGAHTTSDDPYRYRTREEEQAWECRDPLKRLRSYLISKNLYHEEDDKILEEQYGRDVDARFAISEKYPYKLEDVFSHMYTEIPEELKQQQIEYEKFLNWKETQQWQ